jgi:hypothetical protein
MAATCSNIFFAAKNTFCSNFAFFAATFVAAKNDISCSDYKKLTQGQKQIYHDSFINSMNPIIQIEKYFDNTYLYLP